ncbi:Type 1 glutamine amidotransferase-like domain-containing protein [Agromyces mediolanus]|uniref:Type 1 glutamine amidotransferase-like domain-containing protein n=1 Tax=Agromyces mediolanus TaxID=41986 RepID=UPI00203EBDE6|nr:Type 1 glutamine amidotransferase-like domain-containing protein [Agromyces mediolanus]MCM3656611.1 Type 1 glutamine amidotransferase-like domain-containing protein [Agromyces mediolanus]
MSVHLLGGGALEPADAALYAPFLAEAAARARAAGRPVPRIAILSIHPGGPERAEALRRVLAAAGEVEAHLTSSPGGEELPPTAISDVDGILVGGGIVEQVRAALEPLFGELRRQVAGGVPYLGVSAGAMIAAEGALGGGSRIDGVLVAPEDPDEGGAEFEADAGIGLVDVAIDVHVAQRGTLSRLVAAVESGLIDGALGIDERTVLIVGDGGLRVEGVGSVWRVLPGDGGVLVSTIGA